MNIHVVSLLLILFLPSQPNGSIDSAINLYERGEFKKAISLLSQLSKSSNTNPEVNFWLGKSHLKAREWDDAVQELEKAAQLEPSNALYHLWLGRACGFRAAHSIFPMAIPRARRVVKEFEKARTLSPQDINIRFDLLEFYLSAPSMIGGGKNKAQAEAQVIEELDRQKSYIARATIHEKNKDWDLAKKELTQATIDYPRDANAYKDLADFLLNRQDFEGALVNAQKALALESNLKKARFIAAASKIQLGIHLEEAENSLRELAAGPLDDEDPVFEEVYYWLGVCYFMKGDKAKAREAFRSALSYNPDYVRAKNYLSDMR